MWMGYQDEITLYHYTTESNARKIMRERKILQSEQDNRDAIMGDGVYLTDLAPRSKSKFEIARNNWVHGAERKVYTGHLDAAIFEDEILTLYHYTTKSNARKIMRERKIHQSEQDNHDAIMGDGVYLTDLAPRSKSKFEIARNNWVHGAERKVYTGHMDAAIKVKLSREDVDYVRRGSQGRLIYKYDGDLRLPETAQLIFWDDEDDDDDVYKYSDEIQSYLSSSQNQEATSEVSPWKILGGLALGAVAVGGALSVMSALTSDSDKKKKNNKK